MGGSATGTMSDAILLVLDTATRSPLVGLAGRDGRLMGARQWTSRHRHGEELLSRVDELLAEARVERGALAGVIVGTGPGSFTGLRIGLATAKTIAYSLAAPLIGISTTRALAFAASRSDGGAGRFALTLPAGAADRYVHLLRVDDGAVAEVEQPRLVAGTEPFAEAVAGATLVAVDLEDSDVPGAAMALGRAAVAGLAEALAVLGAQALADGQRDDPAQLVPAYVALPRGTAHATAEMKWSPDPR